MSAVVLHSGGMDSSICLLLACRFFGNTKVVSLGFNYAQRHKSEVDAARFIASHLGVKRVEMDIPKILGWETSSLVNTSLPITQEGAMPNSFVPGRNGLFLMMAAPYAKSIGANCLHIGVMEQEGANSGYPDCSRQYIDLVQAVIRSDLQDEAFSVVTPLIHMSKAETLAVAASMGKLEFLLEHTISCYQGIPHSGCQTCPACILRSKGLKEFYLSKHR
jgi:7-cyano-7-deazaguanine synthase